MVEVTGVDYILTDIEGTTSDIAFVKNVLFPYSAREMRNFISNNRSNPKVKECLKQTEQADENGAIEQLLQWIRDDVKHPALKTIQGMIWKAGYENGSYKAHMYPDVKPAFEKWQAQGLPIGIYSSGSVAAQKNFYQYSDVGNLLGFISHHFDLDVGGKREVSSYQKISEALKTKNVLFLSDIAQELDAAREAGFKTVQIVREGTTASDRHPTALNFTQIKIN
ncbi:MAG: acireductone synthase [Bdellovibrionota bacterium]